MKLTDSKCRAAKPKEKAYKLSDGEGLYLYVKPVGSKLWKMSYRFEDKQRDLSFGPYPTVALAEAREKKTRAKRCLLEGIDPRQEFAIKESTRRVAQMHPESFRAFSKKWLELKTPSWSQAHASRTASRLEDDILPSLGDYRVSDITAPMVLECLRKVENRGAIHIAKRCREHINGVFRLAIAEGVASHNPARDIGDALKPLPRSKPHSSLTANQIGPFMKKLATYGQGRAVQLGVEFVLRTMVRTKEVRFARKDEFDLAAGRWKIPAERMKMKRPHIVPLAKQVVPIVEELIELSGSSPFLLPGRRDGVISENTLLFALYRLGYHGTLTIHGFRGTASTILNETGKFNPDWIERQLAHDEEDKVRAAYNAAEYLNHRSEMMQWWSDFIDLQAEHELLLG